MNACTYNYITLSMEVEMYACIQMGPKWDHEISVKRSLKSQKD